MTTRPLLAVVAALCLAAGCSTDPSGAPAAPTAPAPDAGDCAQPADCGDAPGPAVAHDARRRVHAGQATAAATAQGQIPPSQPDGVVGQQVAQLSDEWLQGSATVDGLQLVVFFEAWCPHCQREAPRLQGLYEALSGDGLEIVGLSSLSRGVTEEQLMQFVQQQVLTYPVGKPVEGLREQLRITGVPAAVVLQDGEVLWRGHPARLKEQTLRSWLEG